MFPFRRFRGRPAVFCWLSCQFFALSASVFGCRIDVAAVGVDAVAVAVAVCFLFPFPLSLLFFPLFSFFSLLSLSLSVVSLVVSFCFSFVSFRYRLLLSLSPCFPSSFIVLAAAFSPRRPITRARVCALPLALPFTLALPPPRGRCPPTAKSRKVG